MRRVVPNTSNASGSNATTGIGLRNSKTTRVLA